MRIRQHFSVARLIAEGCGYAAAAVIGLGGLLYLSALIRVDVFLALILLGWVAIFSGVATVVLYPVAAVAIESVRARRSR